MTTEKNSISIKVQIVIEPDGDYFFGWSPDLEGVMVEGETEEETKNILREAILVHIENLFINELPLPSQIFVQEPRRPKRKQQEYHHPQNSFTGSTVKKGTAELQMSLVA